MEVSPLRGASRPENERENLMKSPPPPSDSGHIKVTAINWTANKPEGGAIHPVFAGVFKSENDGNDGVRQASGKGVEMTLDISEEDQKPKHEYLDSIETAELKFKVEDSEPDSKSNIWKTEDLQSTIQDPATMDLGAEESKEDVKSSIRALVKNQQGRVEGKTEVGFGIEDTKLDTKNDIRIVESLELTTERPQKRRRVFMEAVEVPTILSITREREKIKLENIKRDQEHKNPVWKVEVKKDYDLGLSLDTVFRRIDDLNIKEYPINLDDELLNKTVTRDFLSNTFGGNPQATFPRISAKNVEKHGFNDFMCLNLEYNPRAPQRAGFPGLFFMCSDKDLRSKWRADQQRVFVRISVNVWLYIGQYSLIRAAGLTVAEWETLSYNVKTTWAENVCSMEWGKRMRARICLRKTLRREPTVEEIDRNQSTNFKTTSEEVIEAYNSGKEMIGVWGMKCINYDEAFQRDIVEKYQRWIPKENSGKAGKTQKKKRS